MPTEQSLNQIVIDKVPDYSTWTSKYDAQNGISTNSIIIIPPNELEKGMFFNLKDYDLYEKVASGVTSRELWRKNVTPSESGATYTKIGSVLDLIQGPSIKSITIPTSWSGSGPYYKTITGLITGYTITNKSKFDIQIDSDTINQLIEDGVQALYINNNNSVVTIYAVGAAPTQSIDIQISIQETI